MSENRNILELKEAICQIKNDIKYKEFAIRAGESAAIAVDQLRVELINLENELDEIKRSKFEEWIKSNKNINLSRVGKCYEDYTVNLAWDAWRSAANVAIEEANRESKDNE